MITILNRMTTLGVMSTIDIGQLNPIIHPLISRGKSEINVAIRKNWEIVFVCE